MKTQIININQNKELTIKSTELVDIINQFRKLEDGKSELLHKNFMAKIRKELEVLESLGLEGGLNFKPVEYMDNKGEKRPCFELNRDGMLQMLNSESTLVRYKTIEYINQLEEENKLLKQQQTEKAMLLLDIYNGGQQGIESSKKLTEIEVKEATKPLLNTIEEQKPKVEYHDSVLNPTDYKKLVTTTEIAKDLGMSAQKLNKLLHKKKVIFPKKVKGKTKGWHLYSDYQHLIPEFADYHINEHGQILKWTEKGRKYILDLLKNVDKY